MSVVSDLENTWKKRLSADHPNEGQGVRDSIAKWLLGEDPDRFATLLPDELMIMQRAMSYRYRILQERYWNVPPEEGYRRLIKRLSSLFLVRSKVRTWIALSRDRHRTVVDVVQEVIQEIMQSDRHMAQQLAWITECTTRPRLRNLMMLASLEEYCLRPIRNQPLITYRFVNFLRRSQKGGMTQVPAGELIKLVSDEMSVDDSDESLSLVDREVANNYQMEQDDLAQQSLRSQVKSAFKTYLDRNLNETAAAWLELHLQGFSQEQIAEHLQMPIQQVYRLREKINYHAVKVFALREQPEIVLSWLRTSLKDHNFGLAPKEWQAYWDDRDLQQQRILVELKAGKTIEEVAQILNLKPKQIRSQWMQLYLDAQSIRTQSSV